MSDDKIRSDLAFSLIPEWLLDSQVSDKAIRLYCVLHRYADNQTMECFPSIQTLARRAHCTARTVQRALDELVELGAVKKKPRKNTTGSPQSNLYILKRVPSKMSGGGDKNVRGVVSKMSPGGVKNVTLTRTTELEPVELEPPIKGKPKNADDYEPSQRIIEDQPVKYPGIDLSAELEAFRDFHMSKGSQFKDWDRAFRTWLGKAVKWSSKRQPNYRQGVSLVERYAAQEAKELE